VKQKPEACLWRRNLWAVWFAEFTSIVGFTVVMPILPLYVPQLGVSDPDAVTFWSGAIFSVPAVTMALMAPVWGTLADRYGRKLMVERAMFSGAVVIGLMGLARSIQQLVLLRAVQGMLTGTVTAALTLVASTTPRERSGYALGILQMGIYTGASVGPLVGGLITDTWGFRTAFLTTSVLLLVGGLLVAFLVREEFRPVSRSSRGWQALRESIGPVLSSRPLLSAFSIRLMMRMASRLLDPILPTFVQGLSLASWAGFLIQGAGTRAGLVSFAGAAGGALGAILLGQASDRVGPRRVLVTSALISTFLYALQFFVTGVLQLVALQALSGFAMGGVMSALSTAMAALAPAGQQGAVYGVDATVVSVARAVAPMMGATLEVAGGERVPFLGAAVLFGLAGLVAARLLPSRR